MGCLTSARYTMKADVWKRGTKTRNVITGQDEFTAESAKDRTITCQARGIQGGGIRVVGSTKDFQRDDFEDIEWVKMQTTARLSKRELVRNIRKAGTNEAIWLDDDGVTPTLFEVMGVTPIFSPFGDITEYDVLLYKVQDPGGVINP